MSKFFFTGKFLTFSSPNLSNTCKTYINLHSKHKKMFDSTEIALLQKPQQCNSDFKEVEREGKRNENIQSNKLSTACIFHL